MKDLATLKAFSHLLILLVGLVLGSFFYYLIAKEPCVTTNCFKECQQVTSENTAISDEIFHACTSDCERRDHLCVEQNKFINFGSLLHYHHPATVSSTSSQVFSRIPF